MKKKIARFFDIIGGFIAILMLLFLISTVFPYLSGKAGIKIRSLNQSTEAVIDSVRLCHSERKISASVVFYYHFIPKLTDTVIYGMSKVEQYNNFDYTAPKIKNKYREGERLPVYYKTDKRGKYVSNIYPHTSFFDLNSFPFSGFLEYYIFLSLILIVFHIIRKKAINWGIVGNGMISSLFIFLFFWFIYSASPKLQQELFKLTHPSFTEINTENVGNWQVKYTRGRGRDYYITADFTYIVQGNQYKSSIVPVNIYFLFFDKKVANKEADKFKKGHNSTAWVDLSNPEYAVLFANDDYVYLKSTILYSFLGIILFFVLLLFLFFPVYGIKGKIKSRLGFFLFVIIYSIALIFIGIFFYVLISEYLI